MIEKGRFSQNFSAVCYLIAVLSGTIMSAVLALSLPQYNEAYIYLSYLLPQVCYIATVVIFSAVKGIPKSCFLQKKDVSPIHFLMALCVGLGLFFFALLPQSFLDGLLAKSGSNAQVVVPSFSTPGACVAGVLTICILPAVGEELLYRKVFCDGMDGVKEYVIVLLGGLFFSFSHYNLAQTVYQFVLGAVLCFIYIRTKNVTLTMLLHAVNNALALFLPTVTGVDIWENMTVLAISCAAGAILFTVGMLCFFRFCPKKTKENLGVERATGYLIAAVGLLWAISVAVSFEM